MVLNDGDVAWFGPEAEVMGENMLEGEVKQTDRPLFVIALEKLVGLIYTQAHYRNKLILC